MVQGERMKVLEPTVTILLMSHMKPTIEDAIQSINSQTRLNDVQVVIIDSGAWVNELKDTQNETVLILRFVYEQVVQKNGFEWYFTGEKLNARSKYCPVSHWTNYAIKNGLVRGKYLATFYDDDVYHSDFIEKMAGYLDEHSECEMVRCSQSRTVIKSDGSHFSTSPLLSEAPILPGENMDCRVDGGQVMMRMSLFEKIPYPYFPEDPDVSSCSHSDGIFFNKVTNVITSPVGCIPETLYDHRNTIYSTFTPSEPKETV